MEVAFTYQERKKQAIDNIMGYLPLFFSENDGSEINFFNHIAQEEENKMFLPQLCENTLNFFWTDLFSDFSDIASKPKGMILDKRVPDDVRGFSDFLKKGFEKSKFFIFMAGTVSANYYKESFIFPVLTEFLNKKESYLIILPGPDCNIDFKERFLSEFKDYDNFYFAQTNWRIPFHYHLIIGDDDYNRFHFQGPHCEKDPVRENYYTMNDNKLIYVGLSSMLELIENPGQFNATLNISEP